MIMRKKMENDDPRFFTDEDLIKYIEIELSQLRFSTMSIPNKAQSIFEFVKNVLEERNKSKMIVGEKVISAPDDAIKITLLELSKEAQVGLSTNGVKIPSIKETYGWEVVETIFKVVFYGIVVFYIMGLFALAWWRVGGNRWW